MEARPEDDRLDLGADLIGLAARVDQPHALGRGRGPAQVGGTDALEEVGLLPHHVKILGRTRDWLRYDVPSHWVRREWRGSYRGQKQIWYLLRLTGRESDVHLRATSHPEFDGWRWHQYWAPIDEVIVRYARNAREAGLDGVVCSPLEAGLVKEACGAAFQTVTPGIRFADSAADDQARAASTA